MIGFLTVLTLLTFLQTTFLSNSLVLIILIARSFVIEEKLNFILAFSFGLLLSFLSGLPLGSLSLIYLGLVATVTFIKRTQFVHHWPFILPLVLGLLLLEKTAQRLIFGTSFNLLTLLLDFLLILPVYFLLLFWEERFIPTKGIKLKMGK